MASKQALREVYLAKRLFLTQRELDKRSNQIADKAIRLIDEGNHKFIHIFLPIASKQEFDSQLVIDHYNENHNVQFVVPKTLDEGQMEHYLLNENCSIELNKWDIPEPVSGDLIDISKIDIVFVPLIIADKRGHRIGYGKGYYDRFLNQLNAKTVGLSLLPLLDEIPFIESTDVALDECLYYQ